MPEFDGLSGGGLDVLPRRLRRLADEEAHTGYDLAQPQGAVPSLQATQRSGRPRPCHERAIRKGLGQSPRGTSRSTPSALTSATPCQSWPELSLALLCKQGIIGRAGRH